MRRSLVAGNWKMHGSRSDNTRLVEEILRADQGDAGPEILVCPPFVYLWEVGRQLRGSGLALGAQDVCAEAAGAHTGEVSASMLKDVGCTHAIVGHSERRALYGEDDQLVARKFAAAQREGLTPILCVGETLEEREAGRTRAVVAAQLGAVLDAIGPAGLTRGALAYEPVWAIGTGRNATPAQAQDVHAALRAQVAQQNASAAAALRILYGGSVKPANAGELFSQQDIDGGLIGGASLSATDFLAVCAAIHI